MIIYIIWSYFLIRKKSTENQMNSDFKQKRIFYSFVALDFMLIVNYIFRSTFFKILFE